LKLATKLLEKRKIMFGKDEKYEAVTVRVRPRIFILQKNVDVLETIESVAKDERIQAATIASCMHAGFSARFWPCPTKMLNNFVSYTF